MNTGQRRSSPKFRAPSAPCRIGFSALQATFSPDSLSICLAAGERSKSYGDVITRNNCMISLSANHMHGGSRTGRDLSGSSTMSVQVLCQLRPWLSEMCVWAQQLPVASGGTDEDEDEGIRRRAL
jgi:hypothetical protein